MKQKHKALFFDVGGTLFGPFPSVGELYAQMSMKYDTICNPDILEEEFMAAWKRRGGLASLGSETNEHKEREWWYSLVQEVFQSHGGIPRFDEFFERLYNAFEQKESWALYPETIEVLEMLKAKGYTLGIVSNWDLRLHRVIRNMGLAHYFDFIVGSSEVGVTKPHQKIFKEALRRAKCEPHEAVHVGDTFEEDYVGAEGLGIRPFLLDRNGKLSHHPVADESRVKCLMEFAKKIGDRLI